MISYSRVQGQREVHDRAEFTTSTDTGPASCRAEMGGEVAAVRIAVDATMSAIGLHLGAGRRVEELRALVGVPREVLDTDPAPVGLDVVRLDEDLDMWVDLDGAERHPINPAASVVARAFGLHEQVWGPVVFTGDVDAGGVTRDVPVAAAVLLTGIAASCTPERDRRDEWARMGITVHTTDRPTELDEPSVQTVAEHAVGETFDALAHTIATEGDWPRCAECGEYGTPPEHQPETRARAVPE